MHHFLLITSKDQNMLAIERPIVPSLYPEEIMQVIYRKLKGVPGC